MLTYFSIEKKFYDQKHSAIGSHRKHSFVKMLTRLLIRRTQSCQLTQKHDEQQTAASKREMTELDITCHL